MKSALRPSAEHELTQSRLLRRALIGSIKEPNTSSYFSRQALSSALLAVSILAVFASAAQAAQPPLLRQFCNTGSGTGQCIIPRGIAVDQTSGEIYVSDQGNKRIEKFTAWGEFLRSWGWDVVSSGPGDSGTGFEVCVPVNEDACKAGLGGSGAGQFGKVFGPQGVAFDSAGDLYVVDTFNRRVQKFGPEGEFLLMFGGDVNKTKVEEVSSTEAERNLCPVDPGDVCQAGAEGKGKGQFGGWELGSFVGVDSKGTTTAADDTIYVGDQARVQEFESNGHYLGDLPDPDEVLKKEGTVNSLAVDPLNGALYLGFFNPGADESKPNVHKLSPAGNEECTIATHNPSAIALGASGEVYVVDGATHDLPREISSFDPACGSRQPLFPKEDNTTTSENQFSEGAGHIRPTGIAVSYACGIDGIDLFISNPNSENSFVKLFGPPPQDFAPPCNPPAEIPPSIDAQFATSVSADGALVKAQINPHFWPDTTYYVHYGTATCIEAGGWEAACVAKQPTSPQLLSEDVQDAELTTKGIFLGASEPLTPDTDYRYHFVAQSSGGGSVRGLGGTEATEGTAGAFHTYPLSSPAKSDCQNQAFRTAASSHLPDCRAYEMVSPVDKGGGEPFPPRETPALEQAAADGEAFAFASSTAFAGPEGAPLYNQYLSQRDPTGWTTRSINAPRTSQGLITHEEIANPRFKLFSEDLCSGWLLQDTDFPLVEGAPRGVANLYRDRGLHQGCGPRAYQLLSSTFPPGYGPGGGEVLGASEYYPTIQGFSADGEISAFRASAKLSEDACDVTSEQGPHAKGIYQTYLSQNGTLGVPPVLVSVLPNGEANCTHSSVGTALGGLGNDSVYDALSADGTRVYWTATADGFHPTATAEAGQGPGKLYLRMNATQPQSAFNKKGKCSESEAACTLAVSKEAEAASETTTTGSSYLSAAVDGSTVIFSTGKDLYEFDLAKALAGEPPDTLIAHQVKGILGTSTDASRVYLLSAEDLDGAGPAEATQSNLYLYQRGSGFTFIARVANAPSRVTPDGLHAAFVSPDPALALSVAGYDNTDAASGRPDQEVYLYNAGANGGNGELLCASCNPSAARPAGRETTKGTNGEPGLWSAARIPGWVTSTHPGNLLSTDGHRLLFESFEPLLPGDTNGRADVYQWEQAQNKSECLQKIGGELFEPASQGCLSLISSGQASSDAELIDASADGRDVFFLTASSLLPEDISAADVYDARALGGFPAPQAPLPSCEGEACQSPPAAPNDPTPASSSFQGAGNVVEEDGPRCKKGRIRRRGRCVRRHRGGKGRPSRHAPRHPLPERPQDKA